MTKYLPSLTSKNISDVLLNGFEAGDTAFINWETITKKGNTALKEAERKNIDIDIEADGGINLKTATRVKRAGANVLVAGTAILMASDYKVIIDELKEEE